MEPGEGERPPCDDLVRCEVGPGDCAQCDEPTPWTHKRCHVHLCSAACVVGAAHFIDWSIAEAAKVEDEKAKVEDEKAKAKSPK